MPIVQRLYHLLYELYVHRHAVWALSQRDFVRKYIRNYFGLIWAVLDPLAFVGIMYFVFNTRFGNTDAGAVPFVVYLLCGQIAYDLFSSIQGLTLVIKDHDFLLKKLHFQIGMLPLIRMLSSLLLHSIVLILTVGILLLNHITPTLYWLQVFYYMFALSVLLIGAAWTTASIYLFFPDISHIVGIIQRLLFFVTPIFWTMDDLPASTARLIQLNPLVYIVSGYRDSFLHQRGFWEHSGQTLYFWLICVLVWIIGIFIFRKLRPDFAEVV